MTHYSFGKNIGFIVVILIAASAAHAQPARTPEQEEFVTVLGGRIRSASQAEVATLRTQQLQPAILAAQQTEQTWSTLAEQVVNLRDRITGLNDLITNYPRIRGNMDQAAVQEINALRRQVAQLTQQLNLLNTELTRAAAAKNDARERRLAAERIVSSKEGANLQLISDFNYLFNVWQLNPPQYTWEAMSARLIEIGVAKQLTTNVTVSAGSVPVTVKYQIVGAANAQSIASCTQCNVRLPVGHYTFWIERSGTPDSPKKTYLLFRDAHSIDLTSPS